MEPGPLPPHERTWRHPSELAAQERAALRAEAAAPSARVFALTTGALGLLAVGVLIMTVTPRRQESPIAISATTTPIAATTGADPAFGRLRSGAAALSSTVSTRPATLTERRTASALATPIGDGRHAVVTAVALAGHRADVIEVRLASGHVETAEIVSTRDSAVVIVELARAEPGHSLARSRPAPNEIVTVLSSPPITIAFDDVDTLDVHEGTPVLDADGALVGLCSQRHAESAVELVEVTEALAAATSGGR